MSNNLELNIDKVMTTPVTANMAIKLLSSDEYRDDFLMEYSYFHNDGHMNIYIKWINENVDSRKNVILEHVFTLSTSILLYSTKLFNKAHEVLTGRAHELTKLSCLDYIFSCKHKIIEDKFLDINNLAILHTTNQIVKFQAFINLSVYNADSVKRIRSILEKIEYPSLFYRFVNQVDLLPEHVRDEVSSFIISVLNLKSFSEDVKMEIRERLLNI